MRCDIQAGGNRPFQDFLSHRKTTILEKSRRDSGYGERYRASPQRWVAQQEEQVLVISRWKDCEMIGGWSIVDVLRCVLNSPKVYL